MYQEDFLPFGAQYYRAPTPMPGEWERDLKNFREHGFNTIKIWAQWRWNNPGENTYYFDDLDRIMDLAHENGLKVVINTIFDVAPAWFYKKFPDSVMVTCDGKRLEPQTTAWRQIGGAPGPCYHHKEGVESRRQFLQKTAERYKNHPALYLWDIWNEPELTCGIKREPGQDDMVCYCAESAAAFIMWLKEKYGSVEALNKKWHRNYNSWDEIEAPRNGQTFNDMIDWRLFFAYTLVKEAELRAETIREFDGSHPVMLHTVPMPCFNAINACSDDYELAKVCDLFGNSAGSNPFAAAISTSGAPGKTVINAEIHALGGSTYDRPAIPDFETIKKHIMVPLARGVKGFLYWQYRPETLGAEAPAWGLTDMTGGRTDWLDYNITVNNALQKYSDTVINAKPSPAKVAVVNGVSNQIFDWCVTGSVDRHYHSVNGTYMALFDSNINADIISAGQITDEAVRNYKVIYYPFPYYMEEKVAEVLREWVENGGTLISEAFFAAVKEDGLHSKVVPGYGFDEIFGAAEGTTVTSSTFMNAYGSKWSKDDYADSKLPVTTEKELKYISKDEKIPVFFFCEELIPRLAEVLARFENGKAAITHSRYGKGQAVMIGSLLGYMYSTAGHDGVRRMIGSLAALGGVKPVVKTDTDGIRLDLLTGGDGALLIAVSRLPDECEAEVCIGGEVKKLVNIITGEEAVPVKSGNLLKFKIKLAANGCEAYLGCVER